MVHIFWHCQLWLYIDCCDYFDSVTIYDTEHVPSLNARMAHNSWRRGWYFRLITCSSATEENASAVVTNDIRNCPPHNTFPRPLSAPPSFLLQPRARGLSHNHHSKNSYATQKFLCTQPLHLLINDLNFEENFYMYDEAMFILIWHISLEPQLVQGTNNYQHHNVRERDKPKEMFLHPL